MFGEHLLHPTLCIKPFCFAFDQMSSWYSPAGYGWYGSYGSWYGRRRGSWGGKSEVRSDVEWFCQKCGTGNWWSRTDCRHCASVGSDDADIPQSSTQEKIAVLEKTLAGMGDDEPILAGKKVLEKELEKLQKKLNGPKKTAKHIEAKQNWINRESKRLEAESARRNCKRASECGRNIESGLRGNQDSQRGPSERGRNDGQKQEPLLVSGGHGGNPEARKQELAWRGNRLRRDWLGGHETVQRRKSLAG